MKKSHYFTVLISSIIFSLALFSCATTGKLARDKYRLEPSQLIPENGEIVWKEVAPGIRQASFSEPKLDARYELVEIKLDNPSLKIVPLESRPEWMKSTSVKKFARDVNAAVAVNTTPFKLIYKKIPFSKGYPAGLLISGGEVKVEPNERYAAIAFFKDEKTVSNGYTAKIFDSQTEITTLPTLPEVACGGFWTVLDGENIRNFKPIKDIRCAAATKDGGKTLYIFTGLNFTYNETAEFFKSLGAEKAMQFDGGNSTDLVINGKSVLNYGIKRLIVAMVGFVIE